jgi:hypothetical protein
LVEHHGTSVKDTPEGKLYLAMRERCPACQLYPPTWIEGSRSGVGMSVDLFCASCGQGYNVAPHVEIAEVIHVDKSYVTRSRNDH